MANLDEYIRECNLVFTDTIDRLDFCRVDFDINKVKVNYTDSINLLHLVSSFNQLYLAFKKEYAKLEKLDLGKQFKVLSFHKFNFDADAYRDLVIYMNKASFTNRRNTFLHIREINGEIKPFVTNNTASYDEKYYREAVKLDDNLAKQYLDLFEKYSVLLDSYSYLKNGQLFGDGTNVMFTTIDEYHSNLLEELHDFTISIGSSYFDTSYFMELVINLGDNLRIDYDKCKLVLDSNKITADKKDYDKILKNVYINKKHTEKNNR